MHQKDRRNLVYATPFLASSLLLGSACGAEGLGSEEIVAQQQDPINGGTVTTARPEAGLLRHTNDTGWCSASLIDSQWGLTAGHCLPNNARSRLSPPENSGNVQFSYRIGTGPEKLVALDRGYWTGDSGPGPWDVSVFHLSSPVTDVTPFQIATAGPTAGAQVTAFGYGCNSWVDGGSGFGTKRYRTFSYGDNGIVCKGDSGGPDVLGGLSGTAQWGINSGYIGPNIIWGDAVNVGAPILHAAKRLLNTFVTNEQDSDLADTAETALFRFIGDFDNDGRADLAFVTPSGKVLPVYLSDGAGTFTKVIPVANPTTFAGFARSAGVRAISGDFDHLDGTDIALVAGQGWNTIPVAFSQGDGSFNVTNGGFDPPSDGAAFNAFARDSASKLVSGDFNGDHKTDIALLGGSGWNSIPIALSNGNGTFELTNFQNATFASLVTTAGAKLVVGDFDRDGADDLALIGGSGWNTLPVAYSNWNGTFAVENRTLPHSEWFALAGMKAVAGDFDGDGFDDIMMGGQQSGATSLFFAFSPGTTVRTAGFTVGNFPLDTVPGWLAGGSSIPLAGDVNNDGHDDLVLTGPSTWTSVPITFFKK